MRSLRVEIMLPIPLPDEGDEMDAVKAFAAAAPLYRVPFVIERSGGTVSPSP